MRCVLRPIRATEYDPAAALLRACCPERAQTAADWQQDEAQAADAGKLLRRFVAEEPGSGAIAGYAVLWQVRAAKYRMDLAVQPGCRRQGIGSSLLERLLHDLQQIGAETLQARSMESRPEALTFLTRRGFAETQRMCELRLELDTVDLARFEPTVQQLKQRGVTFASLADEQTRCPDFLRRLYRLQAAVIPTWPDPDPIPGEPPLSYEAFVRQFEGRQVILEAFFIAKLREEYIGYSGLAAREEFPGCLDSAGTAVHPDHRRQGVALALKTLGLRYARQQGCAALMTRSANPAMVAVNEKLGFRRGQSEVRLVRPILQEA